MTVCKSAYKVMKILLHASISTANWSRFIKRTNLNQTSAFEKR